MNKEYMNMETITIQDCLDLYEKMGKSIVIDGGKIVGIVKEK